MNILILRSWTPLKYTGTFSNSSKIGLGGTEIHMLRHAKFINDLGHKVTIAGISEFDFNENNILIKGSKSKKDLQVYLKENFDQFDYIFINIIDDLNIIKSLMPHSKIIEVCQNGPHFYNDKFIDLYAFVGYGQFAFYSVKFKKYRNKFMLLPNVSALCEFANEVENINEEDQIIWVGSLNKQGLRRWGQAMSKILRLYPNHIWKLCTPSYNIPVNSELPLVLSKLKLPQERIKIINLNSQELAKEIKKSKIVLTSLGGEDGPSAYLDGHALGVTVLSSDDIIGKYSNPEGTGLRCTTKEECFIAINYLLENRKVRIQLGENGKKWYKNNFHSSIQKHFLEEIIQYLNITSGHSFPIKTSIQSDRKFSLRFYFDRLSIKLLDLKSSINSILKD